jgi:hypothetical protein
MSFSRTSNRNGSMGPAYNGHLEQTHVQVHPPNGYELCSSPVDFCKELFAINAMGFYSFLWLTTNLTNYYGTKMVLLMGL